MVCVCVCVCGGGGGGGGGGGEMCRGYMAWNFQLATFKLVV